MDIAVGKIYRVKDSHDCGSYSDCDGKYIRITNIDASAVIDLAIVTENTNYQVVLTAGCSHLLCQADTAAIAEADTSPNFPTLEDITSIQVRPRGTDDCQVEIFVGLI